MNSWWTLAKIEEDRRREMLNEMERYRMVGGRKASRPTRFHLPAAAYLAVGILVVVITLLAVPG